MLYYPNAKINIGLNIISRRKDRFHNIETIFVPVKEFTDVLEFLPSNKTTFTVSGISIDGNPNNNLVLQAYHLLKDRYSLPNLSIHLHKVIPSGAGLGGGSSDAAFMLKGLIEYFQLPLTHDELTEYAEQLGSDCVFFILNDPSFASGKGEILEPIRLEIRNKYILIIKPPYSVNTKDAYSGIKVSEQTGRLIDLIHLPLSEWKTSIVNDFESTIFKRFPELEKIKHSLYAIGAIYASMSGSGSAVFGIFDFQPEIPEIPANYFHWRHLLK